MLPWVGRVRPLKHKTDDMFGTIRKHQTWLWVIIIAFIRKFSAGFVAFHYAYLVTEKIIIHIKLI